jgi:hypothetical protein
MFVTLTLPVPYAKEEQIKSTKPPQTQNKVLIFFLIFSQVGQLPFAYGTTDAFGLKYEPLKC